MLFSLCLFSLNPQFLLVNTYQYRATHTHITYLHVNFLQFFDSFLVVLLLFFPTNFLLTCTGAGFLIVTNEVFPISKWIFDLAKIERTNERIANISKYAYGFGCSHVSSKAFMYVHIYSNYVSKH